MAGRVGLADRLAWGIKYGIRPHISHWPSSGLAPLKNCQVRPRAGALPHPLLSERRWEENRVSDMRPLPLSEIRRKTYIRRTNFHWKNLPYYDFRF